MGNGQRALPISVYAIIMMVVLVLAFITYGAFTYGEFQRVRADMDAGNQAAARDEISVVMDFLLRDAESAAARFANWEEVRQQIRTPRFYPYRRGRRMLSAHVLPDYVIGAEIYDLDGKSLAKLDRPVLPMQIGIPPPPSYVDFSGAEPTLLIFHSVTSRDAEDREQLVGYVGLRVTFLQQLRENHAYRYVNAPTIHFVRGGNSTLTWPELKSIVEFELRDNPMSEAVSGLLSGSIVNLSVILGLFAMTLFPVLVFLIVRPLRAISAHIDKLKDGPGGLMLEQLGGILPIAETEKIRESLNDYQSRPTDVHTSLEEKSLELWTMAHHDALTGAKNRRAFDEYMEKLPLLLGERDIKVCFALFDVNHFKALNDTYGHSVGDQILKVIAERISAVLHRDEELFRIGGDEFAVVLVDCDGASALRISAGLSAARAFDLDDLQTLQWKADVAMYRAKRPGHANVVMFTEAMASNSEGLFSSWVNTAVYDAVIYGTGLAMHYQPIVDLVSGDVCHYEALVRIRQDGELIQPCNIFQVIEARRLEVELDRAVLRSVLEDLREGKLPPGSGVAINLSGRSVVQDQLCDWLSGFKPFLKDYKLMIEVTETALITQIGLANENLSKLRHCGFSIALDDFGSGYSSVRYLASMPVDIVKFDISLVHGLTSDSQRNLVTHLAQMIIDSGHVLVAEGIEDLPTLEAARLAGFHRGQGLLLGKPAAKPRRDRVSFDNVTAFPSGRRA